MTGISDRAQAEAFARLLPDPPPPAFDWHALLQDDVPASGFNLDDIRLIDAVSPPAFLLLGNAIEKWVAEYSEGWRVREWKGHKDPFAQGHWVEDLD